MGLFTWLFKPAWESKNIETAKNAVNKLNDQTILADLIKNDKRINIRKTALARLNDQQLLADVVESAANNHTLNFRKEAVKKLTDQNILADIAKKNEAPDVRGAAVEKLTDQSALIDIVKTDSSKKVRLAVVEKLIDQGVLAHVAENDEDKDVRQAAAKKLLDQNALIRIAKDDKSNKVRQTAAEKLTDRDLAKEILADVKKSDAGRWQPTNPRLSSNMPLSSLLRIFIFTSGDGRTVLDCPVATGILTDTVGAPLSDVLGKKPLDVVAGTDIGRQIMRTGQFPASAWVAMGRIAPAETAKARDGLYRTTVRPFENPATRESGVCVLLYQAG